MGLNLVTKTPGMEALDQLFRIGNGPSSSHSMGPTRASEIFLARNEKAARFRVTLYGSLSATGRGHFTDQAITDILGADRTEIVWSEEVKPFHPNGLELEAFSADGTRLDRWLCYSIGGGKISDETAEVKVVKIYALDTMDKLLAWCKETGRHLWEYFAEVEGEAGWDYLRSVWQQMLATIERGLHCDGVLPGGLNLPRKARSLHLLARKLNASSQRTCLIAAYAYASNEENAARGRVVTAPTCGSCGTLPAVLRYVSEQYGSREEEILKALAVAGLIGNVAKQNGSISGAEAGCQAEVGVACAMAAGAAAYLMGGTPFECEYAAQMSLEHCLGMTCDPINGLVQIPCIERNVVAANRALVSAELAMLSDGRHLVSFDRTIEVMLETGRDLPAIYRETSHGGLAASWRKMC